MAKTMKFFDSVQSQLFASVQAGADGRLTGTLSLTLNDSDGSSVGGDAKFSLLSAADVGALKGGAVLRVMPPRDSHGAETTKLVHVDLAEADFAWRYTPQKLPQLKPWLVVIVGKADLLQVAGGTVTHVDDSVLAEHPLENSHLWAHAQDDGNRRISRLLSPCALQEFSEYVAAIVPAFNDAGEAMWKVSPGPPAAVAKQFGRAGVLQAFDSWRFWTAEKGDFETLSEALRVQKTGDAGTVSLRYHREVAGIDVDLQLRGAITSLKAEPDQAADVAKARADLDTLNKTLPDTELDKYMPFPDYGRPWLADTGATTWSKTLNDDPRFRAIAGMGVQLGVDAQDDLMDAAVQQAGALDAAAGKVRDLALGLEAAGRLWTRRLAADPVRRLVVLGTALERIPAEGGGTVLGRVTDDSRTLVPAVFSSAAARALRGGTARSRHAATPIRRDEALKIANKPNRDFPRTIPGRPHADDVAVLAGEKPLEVMLGMRDGDLSPELRGLIKLFEGAKVDASFVTKFSAELAALGFDCGTGPAQSLMDAGIEIVEHDMLVRAVRRCVARKTHPRVEGGPDLLDAGVDNSPLPDPDPDILVDLGVLSAAVFRAIDPTADPAPALGRLRDTIHVPDGLTLRPLELPLGLDFPTWQLVNKSYPEWLLPGISTIPGDSILALRSNPAFIDAFLVGINAQFLAEMRWRRLAVRKTFTPLRMFWGYVNHGSGQREADILPISAWAEAPASQLGDPSHQALRPGATKGQEDLVILFRTDLFRRYPNTLIYLVKPDPVSAAAQAAAVAVNPTATSKEVQALLQATPEFSHTPADRDKRVYFGPIFMGNISPDVQFFAFDVEPSTLDEYWLVLDEPPAELRFRQPGGPVNVAMNAGQFANTNIDHPTRVAISGLYLEQQGLA
jgi:hypothetical protein